MFKNCMVKLSARVVENLPYVCVSRIFFQDPRTTLERISNREVFPQQMH
jgi:hypothetical protein